MSGTAAPARSGGPGADAEDGTPPPAGEAGDPPADPAAGEARLRAGPGHAPAPRRGAATLPVLPDAALARLVTALLADELGRIRGRPLAPADWAGWTAATTLDEEGVGADSLARLDLVARLNRFFHLHETGIEDYLLVRRTLGDWIGLVAEARARAPERLTFETSGSTGVPKSVTHRVADLAAEIRAHLRPLAPPARVLALVPPHHIYGFLFTVLLPAMTGAEVVEARLQAPAALPRHARPGDLAVATPFLWDHVAKGGLRFAAEVTGVSSGAPAPDALWPALGARGLARLVEIYGASETAGIGWRDGPGQPFRLLSHLARADGDGIRRRRARTRLLPLQDHLVWEGEGFRPAGRRDGAVQVAGVNVFPARVADRLCAVPGVAAAAVRLDPGLGRLKAFLVPEEGAGEEEIEAGLATALAALPAPERPVRWRFGPALPLGPTGKAADWPAE